MNSAVVSPVNATSGITTRDVISCKQGQQCQTPKVAVQDEQFGLQNFGLGWICDEVCSGVPCECHLRHYNS